MTINDLFVIFVEKSKSKICHIVKKTRFLNIINNQANFLFFIKLALRHIFYRVSNRSNSTFCRNQNFVCLFKLAYFVVTFFFASKISISHFENHYFTIAFSIFVVVANKYLNSKINFISIFVIAKKVSNVKFLLAISSSFEKSKKISIFLFRTLYQHSSLFLNV